MGLGAGGVGPRISRLALEGGGDLQVGVWLLGGGVEPSAVKRISRWVRKGVGLSTGGEKPLNLGEEGEFLGS